MVRLKLKKVTTADWMPDRSEKTGAKRSETKLREDL
jgi:hypothetical protein